MNEINSKLIWELIRQFSPEHPDYPIVVTFLAKYASELEKGLSVKITN